MLETYDEEKRKHQKEMSKVKNGKREREREREREIGTRVALAFLAQVAFFLTFSLSLEQDQGQ